MGLVKLTLELLIHEDKPVSFRVVFNQWASFQAYIEAGAEAPQVVCLLLLNITEKVPHIPFAAC